MIINALHLAHFKAFAHSQRVPIRPITLIYGTNSSGKSSIIHSLALAHHAYETGNLDVQRTRVGGDSIHLGGFRQYVHCHERDRQVEIALELKPTEIKGSVAEFLGSVETVTLKAFIGADIESSHTDTEWDPMEETDPEFTVRIVAFSLQVDDQVLLTMRARHDGLLRLDRLDQKHPVFRELLNKLTTLGRTELNEGDYEKIDRVIERLKPNISARVTGLFPHVQEPESDQNMDKGDENERAVSAIFPHKLMELINSIVDEARGNIRKLQYLGPLRSYPSRHLALSQHHDTNWFAGGGYAWDVVRQRRDVREQINRWIGNKNYLKTPYELTVRALVPEAAIARELPGLITRALHKKIRALLLSKEGQQKLSSLVEELTNEAREAESNEKTEPAPEIDKHISDLLDTHALAEDWGHKIVDSQFETLQDLVLIDKRSGTPVSHRDVGIGVSQVLPVLVAAYASRERLIAIEQPEIHLHPAMQAELGDLFIESAMGEARNTFILETHSEHILLRIMRRMRETSNDKLPKGARPIEPKDVTVLFVEPHGASSLIREMPLNEQGELVKAWPGGFFEEGFREIF